MNKRNREARASAAAGAPREGELELINGYTRRALTADEVYVFSLVLCDNDVDRDGERFTLDALYALEGLFVGKTGIVDHNPSALNQCARIISCAVRREEGKATADGEALYSLTARAYIPRTTQGEALIAQLEGGILKEVSVGCAVGRVQCSICGEELSVCAHRKGERYGGKLCVGELCDPYDAYEFSFVAVPSQRAAGVTKAYRGKEDTVEDILKRLGGEQGATFSKPECERLLGYLDALKQSAKDGVYYRSSLVAEVLRLSAAVQPEVSRETMESVAKGMTVAQLGEFKAAYEKKLAQKLPAPQLCGGKQQPAAANGEFRI